MWAHARRSHDERRRGTSNAGEANNAMESENKNASIKIDGFEPHSATNPSELSSSSSPTPDTRKRALSNLLHPHRRPSTESTADGNNNPPPGLSPINIMATQISNNVQKAHTSPSKASYGRTYDSKLVSREMARLGGLTSGHGLSQTPSSSSVGTAPSISQSSISSGSNDSWGALHVHVLPLFNGEPLRIPIETLNILVRRHVQSVVSSAPSKAVATLEQDSSELIASGMVTINAKFNNIEDDKLLSRVVEIWVFFWDSVLTYLEGVLLPLQTDPILSSLYRKPHRGSSPTRQGGKSSASGFIAATSSSHIDVRSIALRSFRDRVILPLSQRLYKCLSALHRESSQESSSYQQPRLQQMLLVLASQSSHRSSSLSLTVPTPQMSAGEQAISDLLQCLLSPRHKANGRSPISPASKARAPSFLSAGAPRDRRGRIAQKQKSDLSLSLSNVDAGISGDSGDEFGGASVKNGIELVIDAAREKDREFLEALKSPDPESAATRASIGGWGLGVGQAEHSQRTEDDEDETLSWDQAQAQVERMLGMNATSPQYDTRRTK